MKLASQIKSKKKALEDVRKKADPMSEEPGLRRDIDRLNTQAHNLVSTGLSMHALMCCISRHYLQQSQRCIKQLRIAEKLYIESCRGAVAVDDGKMPSSMRTSTGFMEGSHLVW